MNDQSEVTHKVLVDQIIQDPTDEEYKRAMNSNQIKTYKKIKSDAVYKLRREPSTEKYKKRNSKIDYMKEEYKAILDDISYPKCVKADKFGTIWGFSANTFKNFK